MIYLRTIAASLAAGFRRFADVVFRRQRFIVAEHVVDLPETLLPHKLYVVGVHGHQWYAAMLCPDGCGAVLEMNLVQTSRPCWRFTEDPRGNATLFPSVWRKTQCHCHFWLRGGRVERCSRGDEQLVN